MKLTVELSKVEVKILKELETATGLDASSIISNLLWEVHSSYKCSKISKNIDYMPCTLLTNELLEDIKS